MATRAHEASSRTSAAFVHFSLMGGGPLHRLAQALGLPSGGAGFVTLGVALAILTWAPLFVLTAAAGTLTSGPIIPFSESTGTHVRLLVAIPLFFVAEAVFDVRVRRVVRKLALHLVAPRRLPRLTAALLRAKGGPTAGSWKGRLRSSPSCSPRAASAPTRRSMSPHAGIRQGTSPPLAGGTWPPRSRFFGS